MKQKLIFVLSLVAMAWSSAVYAAERVAPTFPSDQAKTLETLESEKNYCLYNPASDRFLYNKSAVYADTENRNFFVVSNVEDNIYTFNFINTNSYLYSDGASRLKVSAATTTDYLLFRRFRINAVDGGYTIQRDYNYVESQFVGHDASNANNYVSSALTEGNIVWQLYDEDGAKAILHYRAKKALYDALVSADDYSFAQTIEDYEALYANDAATTDELNAAAKAINSALTWTKNLSDSDTEYPAFLELTGSASWAYYSSGKYYYANLKGGEGGLKATVNVDGDATLSYSYQNTAYYNGFTLQVYLDGELCYTPTRFEGEDAVQYYYVEMGAGTHTIEWKATSTDETNTSQFRLQDINVTATPTITVNLTQAGSLGTEVLYDVDHVKDVRKLVVKGKMNDADWERVNMMTGLYELDIYDTDAENLPKLSLGHPFHKIRLPKGLKTIAANALENINIEQIELPATLTSIGNYAFRNTRISEVNIPESVTSIGAHAFDACKSLTNVVWPSSMASIPDYCFYTCHHLSTMTVPAGVTTIGEYAFYQAYKLNFQLPSTLKTIKANAFPSTALGGPGGTLTIPDGVHVGYYAFSWNWDVKKIIIGEGVTFDGQGYAFYRNDNLEEIEFPTNFNNVNFRYGLLNGCGNLKTVTLKSPTVVGGDTYKSFMPVSATVRVPDFAVNAYKLDSYWYNYPIEGFSTEDVTDWTINNQLTFYSQDRFAGTPNITLVSNGSWTINGETAQAINNLTTNFSLNSGTSSKGQALTYSSQLLSNCDNVSISGDYTHQYYTNANKWYFICLPFDIKVCDIAFSVTGTHFAIRYYDGASRAANGTGDNWKDYATDAVIAAGTGFILQTSKECTTLFKPNDNTTKQNVVSNHIFTKALDANVSEQNSNKGWNLVGNPWLSYYNIHKLNFTAPITVYDNYLKKYNAYSVIDDDYAILPNQAFFVQRPDEINEISFPVDGRQITATIESQNGARAREARVNERKLVDVEINDGELTDKTRFVMNPEASMDYETSRDASKFLETGTSCPQLYTIEQGELLAINERPIGDGMVQLGLRVPHDSMYTICAPRCQFSKIMLIDNEAGTETEISNDGCYAFTASAGIYDNRFVLRVDDMEITNIENVNAQGNTSAMYYNMQGQRVVAPQKGIYIVNGKKIFIK